jgi:hypothetical protein
MSKLCFMVIVLTLFPAFGTADSIYSVDITSYFAAKNACSSDCLETISANFQYDWGGYTTAADGSQQAVSFIVPGSFSFTSQGFLGPLSSTGEITGYWIPLLDSAGDEVDIQGSDVFFLASPLHMTIYSCQSQTCQSDFGPVAPIASYIPQSYGLAIVNVPEPSSFAMFLIPTIILGVAALRRSRLRRDSAAQVSVQN